MQKQQRGERHSCTLLRPSRHCARPRGCRNDEQSARQEDRLSYLEERGYVSRTTDPSDRRAKRVQLTDKGRSAQPVALQAIAEIEAEWKAVFGSARFERLRSELAALRDVLENATANS